jgi:polyisoprenoid-binding protein YceI
MSNSIPAGASAATMTTAVPVGTWVSDKVHSTFDFSARHMVVATYHGSLPDFDVTLVGNDDGTARIEARARVGSVTTAEENLTGHLLSPEFFDAEKYPEVTFTSTDITREDDHVVVRGQMTAKGTTKDVTFHGEIVGPAVAFEDQEKLGLTLEATIDRREFHMHWNATLPTGGLVLGNEVKLVASLELNKA